MKVEKKHLNLYVVKEVADRLDKHCEDKGLVKGIFVERAIKAELDKDGEQ